MKLAELLPGGADGFYSPMRCVEAFFVGLCRNCGNTFGLSAKGRPLLWDPPDEHSAEYFGSARNADSSTRSPTRVRFEHSTVCFICRARDTIDQEISARWLTARLINHTPPISQSQFFGVMRCPIHAWRMYATYTSHTTHVATDTSDIYALQQVLSVILHDFASLAARLARRSLHSHNIRRRYPHIEVVPACPLCGEAQVAVEQKALRLFVETFVAASPAERQNLVWALCPSDHRLSLAHLSQLRPVAAFPPPPMPRPLTGNDGWWQVPGHSIRGRPFVRSMLDASSTTSVLPDLFCPLCWVRAHQEQMLAAVMQQGLPYVEGTESAVVEVRGEQWGFETALAWDVETLCSRHMALVRIAHQSDTPSSEHAGHRENAEVRSADSWNPSQWPSGALWATPPIDTCPLCRVLSGWDVVRQEGLLRAARKTPLLEDITWRLREALKARQTALCLPHWQALTITADSEALETLLGWQFRSVWTLQDRLDAAARQLNDGNPADGGGLEAFDPRRAAYLFLAGYPR